MMRLSRLAGAALWIGLVALGPGGPVAAQPPAPAKDQTTIKTNVDEVLMDIVVRDKKGKPVYDVKPGDVTVTDNGVKQKLSSFRMVQGGEAVPVDFATSSPSIVSGGARRTGARVVSPLRGEAAETGARRRW